MNWSNKVLIFLNFFQLSLVEAASINMKKSSVLPILLAFLLSSVGCQNISEELQPPPENPVYDSYRLPTAVTPENYKLNVITHLNDTEGFIFKGSVWITVSWKVNSRVKRTAPRNRNGWKFTVDTAALNHFQFLMVRCFFSIASTVHAAYKLAVPYRKREKVYWHRRALDRLSISITWLTHDNCCHTR